MNKNLFEISNFIKKNDSFSDLKYVNNLLSNLNYTKISFKNKNQKGGVDTIQGNVGLSPEFLASQEINRDEINNYDQNTYSANLINQQKMYNATENLNYQDGIANEAYQQLIEAEKDLNLKKLGYNSTLDEYYDANTMLINSEDQVYNDKIQRYPNNRFLNQPSFLTSDITNTYTIPEGTILYHSSSNKQGFNERYLKLGNDKLINFFTPHFRLASDRIQGCSLDNQNGFIHVFKVVKEIPNIYIRFPYDLAENIDSGILNNEFCSQNQNYYGIGFFYPKNNIERFTDNNYNNLENDGVYYSEFGLCNPKPYLEYLYSHKCMSLRKLSDPFLLYN